MVPRVLMKRNDLVFIQYDATGRSLQSVFDCHWSVQDRNVRGCRLDFQWNYMILDVIHGIETLHSHQIGSGSIEPCKIYYVIDGTQSGRGQLLSDTYQNLDATTDHLTIGKWPYYVKSETFSALDDLRALLIIFLQGVYVRHFKAGQWDDQMEALAEPIHDTSAFIDTMIDHLKTLVDDIDVKVELQTMKKCLDSNGKVSTLEPLKRYLKKRLGLKKIRKNTWFEIKLKSNIYRKWSVETIFDIEKEDYINNITDHQMKQEND